MELITKNGYGFIIDDEDFKKIKGYIWHGVTDKRKRINGDKRQYHSYVYTNVCRDGKRTGLGIHSLIMNTPNGLQIDHINGNGLDNRKQNLRLCTASQNQANRKIPYGKRFKGVRWSKSSKRWEARIKVNKTSIHIGYFDFEEDAAAAYNDNAKEHFGEFAKLNDI